MLPLFPVVFPGLAVSVSQPPAAVGVLPVASFPATPSPPPPSSAWTRVEKGGEGWKRVEKGGNWPDRQQEEKLLKP